MSYDQTQDQQPADEQPATSEEQPADDASMEFDPAYVAGGKKPMNKQAVLLGGVLVAGAVGVWFMYFHKGPDSASATVDNSKYEQVANFDAGKIDLMKQTLKDTERVVQQFRSYPGRTQVPLTNLHANPFRELMPKEDKPAPIAVSGDRDEEARHKKMSLAVADLRLQSIIKGRQPACMINNTFYRKGDQIGDLVVEEIGANAVIVRGEKWRFELSIQK